MKCFNNISCEINDCYVQQCAYSDKYMNKAKEVKTNLFL